MHPSATAVWPPTGIAIAALLLVGERAWAGVFIGAFFANLTTEGSTLSSLGIAGGNTLEALVAARLVRRFAGGVKAFERPQDFFKFLILAGITSTALGATVGVSSLSLTGYADVSDFGTIWLTWWLGDAAGALVVAPALVLWGRNRVPSWNWGRALEAAALLLALVLTGLAVFGGISPFSASDNPVKYLLVPVLVWPAFRFGPREAATANLFVWGIAIWGTLAGSGPFAVGPPDDALLLLQWRLGLTAVLTLALSAAVLDRRRAEERISEGQRVEGVLRAGQAYGHLILETAHIAFVEIDQNGLITGWNPEAERTFGWSREEAIGRPMAETIIPPRFRDAHHRGLAHFLATGEGPVLNRAIELTALRRDETEFPVELTISAMRYGGKQIFTAFALDISERKRVEESLQRSSRALEAANAELDTFAYSVAHDLRAPLRGIDGFSQILLEDYGERLDAAGKDSLQRVRAASQGMAVLIDDLLALSRVTRAELHRESVDLSALARGIALSLEQAEPDRQAEFIIAPGITAYADPALMRVALENLLGNAWKYTRKHEHARIEFGITQPDGAPVYYVRDDGAGFNMKYVEKLFGAFQRLHAASEFEGVGVGLATVRRIIDRHGGRVWAEGAVEHGATLYFALAPNGLTERAAEPPRQPRTN